MSDDATHLFREEKRSTPQVPLSTLEVITGYLAAHTATENARMDDLKSDVVRVEGKVDALLLSLNSWMDKEPATIIERCEEMFDEAIPAHKDNPDATPAEKRKEHRRAHAKWMQKVEEELDRIKQLRLKIADWAIFVVLSGLIVWVVWSVTTYLGKPPP